MPHGLQTELKCSSTNYSRTFYEYRFTLQSIKTRISKTYMKTPGLWVLLSTNASTVTLDSTHPVHLMKIPLNTKPLARPSSNLLLKPLVHPSHAPPGASLKNPIHIEPTRRFLGNRNSKPNPFLTPHPRMIPERDTPQTDARPPWPAYVARDPTIPSCKYRLIVSSQLLPASRLLPKTTYTHKTHFWTYI